MNPLIEYIAKKTGKTSNEIAQMADDKKTQLSGMITIEGALSLVALQLGLKLNKTEGKIIMEDENQNLNVEESENVSVGSRANEEELSLDDFSKKYIKSPKVGESVEFTLKKIIQSKNIDAVDKSGRKFKTNMTSVDYKIILLTMKDEEYSPKSWEVFNKVKAICSKIGKIPGIELQIKHIKDGMKDKNNEDNYSVKTKIDGAWKELDKKTGNFV
jgi:hypothetical protein